jgi:ribokinase
MDPDAAAAAVSGATDADVVVGQLETPQAVTSAAFGAARARGATTILNPAPAADLQRTLLDATDWLVPNEVEFAHLAAAFGIDAADPTDGAALRAVVGATGTGLVVTLGAAGAVAVDRAGRFVRTPAVRVNVVDTTGAGDAFVGAFAYAIACGTDLAVSIQLACALASDSVRRPGTQRSFPSAAACIHIADGFGVRRRVTRSGDPAGGAEVR